jgi:hypothetical protein
MNSRSLCLVLLLSIGCIALANEAAMYAEGGTIRPMKEHTSITMEKEIVNADIHPNVAYVKCVFTLYNTSSKPKTVLMGFPEEADDSSRIPEFIKFKTWVDGKLVKTKPTKWEEMADYTRYRVTKVTFAGHQRRVVRVEYTGRMTHWPEGDRTFKYISWTGASWKGRIGLGEFNFNISKMKKNYTLEKKTNKGYGTFPVPKGYLLHKDKVSWRIKNFKPSPDPTVDNNFDNNFTIFSVSFKAKNPTKRE